MYWRSICCPTNVNINSNRRLCDVSTRVRGLCVLSLSLFLVPKMQQKVNRRIKCMKKKEEAATNGENVQIHGHIIIIETDCSGVFCDGGTTRS